MTVHAAGAVSIVATDHAAITAETHMATSAKRTNNLGAGLLNSTINTLLKEYQYTSNSGSPLIKLGERVRVADDYSDVNARGKVFQFMGSDRVFDLGTANYADFELWKELMDTNVITKSVATAAVKAFDLPNGGSKSYYALVARNDVRAHAEAFVHGTALSAAGDVTVEAVEDATIASADDSVVAAQSTARGGVIVTNQVQATADAFVRSSSVTTDTGGSGGLAVHAAVTAAINATATTTAKSG